LFTLQVVDFVDKDQQEGRNDDDRVGTKNWLLLVSEQILNRLTPLIQVKDLEVNGVLPPHSDQQF
jgi:hypothetical protein